MRASRREACWSGFLALGLLAGCSPQTALFGSLPEGDANEVIAVLGQQGVHASKAVAKQGFSVSVPPDEFSRAVDLLKADGLPRRPYVGLGDVFKKDGMISTPLEERGRYLYALSQELERSLSGIDGVVLARVHPVLPERLAAGEPVQAASCAVLIKYRPGWDPNLYEERIRRLVTAGIPGLAAAPADHVSIVFVEAAPALVSRGPASGDTPYPAATAIAAVAGLVLAGVAVAWAVRRHGAGRGWRSGRSSAPRQAPDGDAA